MYRPVDLFHSSWLFPQVRKDGIVYYHQTDFTPGREQVTPHFCPNHPEREEGRLSSHRIDVCRSQGVLYRTFGWRKEDV